MRLTSRQVRLANHFSFGPIVEVAKLFAGIFVTIAPAIALLRAGSDGVLAPVIAHDERSPTARRTMRATSG